MTLNDIALATGKDRRHDTMDATAQAPSAIWTTTKSASQRKAAFKKGAGAKAAQK